MTTILVGACGCPEDDGCLCHEGGDADEEQDREDELDGGVDADTAAPSDSDISQGGDGDGDIDQGDGDGDVDQEEEDALCVPRQCSDLERVCGEVDDGCGGTLSCGGCARPLQCVDGACECQEPSCRILCEGEVFEGYTSRPFELSADDSGAVIRGCTFRRSNQPAITILGAREVLIEGCLFESIRAGEPDRDVHAINIPREGYQITIRDNEFVDIGADGVQMGHSGDDIEDVVIANNLFWVTNDDVGENGIDVKATTGPIEITGNEFHGFRPCEEGQDCTGSEGACVVVHSSSEGPATGLRIAGNRFWDCTQGLVVSSGSRGNPPEHIVVVNNWFYDNISFGIRIDEVRHLDVLHNTFVGNAQHLWLRRTPAGADGECSIVNNLYVGSARVDEGCDPVGNLSLEADEAAFVDLEGRDLHLTPGSAAHDAAIDLPAVSDDIDGQLRPHGGAPDVGADELY